MDAFVDIGLVRGLLTLAVFTAFMVLVFWAYSGRRRRDFDAASRLPLESDTQLDRPTRVNEEEAHHV